MNKLKFFAALCCAAMVFAACDKNDEPKNDKNKDNAATGAENGYEWVNLGLPSGIKWATYNVDADKPEGYGYYFAWGETETKDTYSWDNYKYGSDSSQLTKYCNNSDMGKGGFTDELTTLESDDDAATKYWGGAWRTPTQDEWKELKENCEWTWKTQNGVDGYEVKGANGNSIFLPAAGFRSDNELSGEGNYGYYWSSSLYTTRPDWAQCVYISSSYVDVKDASENRCFGFSVRPVLD